MVGIAGRLKAALVLALFAATPAAAFDDATGGADPLVGAAARGEAWRAGRLTPERPPFKDGGFAIVRGFERGREARMIYTCATDGNDHIRVDGELVDDWLGFPPEGTAPRHALVIDVDGRGWVFRAERDDGGWLMRTGPGEPVLAALRRGRVATLGRASGGEIARFGLKGSADAIATARRFCDR